MNFFFRYRSHNINLSEYPPVFNRYHYHSHLGKYICNSAGTQDKKIKLLYFTLSYRSSAGFNKLDSSILLIL